MNPMPLALENQRDALRHDGAAILRDRNVVLKIGHAPGFRLRRARESAEEQRENNNLWDFQLHNSPN